MKTYVATENRGKLAEMQAMFAGTEIELATFAGYRAVEEGSASYLGNAMLKAESLRAQLDREEIEAWVLADDSGLEVDALGGRPGVLSARYAGAEATWSQRRRALLEELRDIPVAQRGAHFVAHLVLLRSSCDAICASGAVEGRIALQEAGISGFGYDPIFYFEPAHRTFAELDEAAKNAVSHRYRAVCDLLAKVRAHA